MAKKDIYAKYGIEYNPRSNKIVHPVLGSVRPLLINGNKKIGKGAWHYSTLPGTELYSVVINGTDYSVKGTCVCDCIGCYAKSGNYRYQSVKNALGIRTWIAWNDPDFMIRAIMAQIEADHITTIRVHASGDFCTIEYLTAWTEIVKSNPCVVFWTYTKNSVFECAFDPYENANIVKSVVPGYGFNFGHADYIVKLYAILKNAGKSVHVCRCGIDSNQHCTNCTACSKCEFVLFLEHGTSYNPVDDPAFPDFVALVNSQENEYLI